jgi:hypothetical protein
MTVQGKAKNIKCSTSVGNRESMTLSHHVETIQKGMRNMRRLNSVRTVWGKIISLGVMVSFSGCSFFAPSMQTIHVTSSPSEAKVVAGGRPVGQTPVQFEAHRGENLLIEVQKPGYQTQYRTSSRTLSTIGTLDVIGGFLFLLPLFGLLWNYQDVR